jgi:hypothetical protein
MREALWWMTWMALACAAPARAYTLAVVPFGDADAALIDAVRTEAGALTGATVVSRDQTHADVRSAAEAGLLCGAEDDDCLVRLALFTHADTLVSVSATADGNALAVRMVAVDAEHGTRVGAASVRLAPPRRRAVIANAVEEVLTPERVLGSVVVETSPPDATIWVDGEARGTGPKLALRLRKGSHELPAERAGHRAAQASVDVDAGDHLVVPLELPRDANATAHVVPVHEEPAEPPAESPRVMVGVVSMIVGGVLFASGVGTALVLDTVLTGSSTGDARTRDTMLRTERVAAVVAAVGVPVVVMGAVLALVAPSAE